MTMIMIDNDNDDDDSDDDNDIRLALKHFTTQLKKSTAKVLQRGRKI